MIKVITSINKRNTKNLIITTHFPTMCALLFFGKKVIRLPDFLKFQITHILEICFKKVIELTILLIRNF